MHKRRASLQEEMLIGQDKKKNKDLGIIWELLDSMDPHSRVEVTLEDLDNRVDLEGNNREDGVNRVEVIMEDLDSHNKEDGVNKVEVTMEDGVSSSQLVMSDGVNLHRVNKVDGVSKVVGDRL